jgi:hypothetical protein
MNNAYLKFTEEATEIIKNLPALQLHRREDSLPFLEGKITLCDESGVAYDAYQIRIECSNDYPNSFPTVYETSERLPPNIDWHIYPDGHFCICTSLEESIYCCKGLTLTRFINDQIVPYLHNQSFREKEGYFLQERSHGIQGTLESLKDILKTNDLQKIYALLIYIYINDTPSRISKCFCGSKKKYRHCHKEAYRNLKDIGQHKLLQTILSVKENLFN